MNTFELFRLAFGALAHNRLRSVLTVLGIVIGVAAVVALVSFGTSYQSYVDGQFSGIGSTTLFIGSTTPTGPNAITIKPKPLTMTDAAAIADPNNVQDVVAVAPTFGVNATLVANSQSMTQNVTGTTEANQIVQNQVVSAGRFITPADVNASNMVAVIGTAIVAQLFPGNPTPVGEVMRVNGQTFTIVGVLKARGGGTGNQDKVVVIPITTAQYRLGGDAARTADGQYRVSQIAVMTTGAKANAAVQAAITTLLSARHGVKYVGDEDFRIFSLGGIVNTLDSILGLLTVFLAAIASISLLVGGIGVMNIMMVSVSERTKEIGLRKAVGARYRDLLLQFLIESITLCLLGGLLGVGLGVAVCLLGGLALPTLKISVSVPAMILSVGVSSAIGMFFGIYPASRAAVLKPIEALRYE
jgi:putative ABC transport system permease protein